MSDIKKLAQAVLDVWLIRDVERGKNAFNQCLYCNDSVYYTDPIEWITHSVDCPVPLAQRIMEE